MAQNNQKIGWIGMGRMGFSMAERLVKAGYDLSVWNRTKSKAEPLAKSGAKIVDKLSDLAGVDVLFSIVSAGPDLDEVYFGKSGVVTTGGNKLPKIFVDCSTIAVEEWVAVRARLKERGSDFICAPVSGNAKVIKAFAPRGVSYVGEGELARVCKIAHNVMLGVVIENLIEITLLTNKMGVPRHAF